MPAGVSEPHFHGWGREGKRHLQRRFLRKRGAVWEAAHLRDAFLQYRKLSRHAKGSLPEGAVAVDD